MTTQAPMPTSTPFLLIMPSYNQAHYIASAVDSVLAQDDPNWVLWIVDNSSDNTPSVMKAYTDPRIHFEHIPQRMDPGSCLNRVLEREGEKHRDFSYIHTDNLLRADYVRQMRAALSQAEDCVAYCDMNSLDANGHYTGVSKRGSFDLARLFSFSTLGVPFSATTQLGRQLGGFNRMDVADDVIFCVRAWPRARFVYIPDAIMDYRTHGDSRTTAHGGAWEIERSFLNSYVRLLPEMRERGADPIAALADRLRLLQIDMRLRLNHISYRLGPRLGPADQPPTLAQLVTANLLELCDLQSPAANDAPQDGDGVRESKLRRLQGKIRKRWLRIQSRIQGKTIEWQHMQHIDRRALWEQSTLFRHHAVPWVYLSATELDSTPVIRLASTDIYTLWISLVVHRMCGWRFQVSSNEGIDLKAWPQLDVLGPRSPKATVTLSLAPDAIGIGATPQA
jgi:glycosyltransferase involved in cell wall biosynthesis